MNDQHGASPEAYQAPGIGDLGTPAVSDDGQAAAGLREWQGHGLRGMRERTLAISAGLLIGASATGGTEVRLAVPAPE